MKIEIKLISTWMMIMLLKNPGASQVPELVLQRGHLRSITSICFSPDGKEVLTGSQDGTAKLWDLSGRELRTFFGHTQGITSVAFSPNNNAVLTGSFDGTAILWSLEGKKITTFSDHPSHVLSVAFAPDGTKILIGSDVAYARLWDLNGQELQSYEFEEDTFGSNHVAFSPDGSRILTHDLTQKMEKTTLWDISGAQLSHFDGDYPVFSSDGKHILSIVGDTVKVWDLKGREVRYFTAEDMKDVSTAIFSPDGAQILAGFDGGAKLWSIKGTELKTFKLNAPAQNAVSVDFSPDGKLILAAYSTGEAFSHGIIMWNLQGKRINVFNVNKISPIGSVGFLNNNSQLIARNSDSFYGTPMKNETILWDLSGRTFMSSPVIRADHAEQTQPPSSSQIGIKISPDGSQALQLSKDSITLTDRYGQVLKKVNGRNGFFSPDGKTIAILTSSSIILWDRKGEMLQYKEHADLYVGAPKWPIEKISDLLFSPDGSSIILKVSTYLSMRDHLSVWDIASDTLFTIDHPIESVSGRDLNSILAFCFSPDENYILTGGTDNTARLWDIKGELIRTFTGHSGYVTTVSFSTDGDHVLTGSEDGTIKLWECKTGKLLLTFISLQDQEEWMMVTGEEYYAVSKNASVAIGFTIDLTAYNFDQFDLRLNRPDKVLETLLPFGADPNLIRQYRQAYYKRLEKHGFTEDMLADDYHLPECAIQNQDDIPISTTESSVKLNIYATDTLRTLDRLNVSVNDVPIYGISGINLRGQNTREYTATLEIPLSQGQNKIQVSALNQGGAESLKATTYITYDAPEQKTALYLITIGVSDYQAAGKDLQYAAKDAQDIAALYQNTSGFGQVYTKVLTNAQVTKSNILALRAWLEQSGVDDQVLIYVSGHGLLDDNYDFYYATHDMDFAHPAEKGILYDDIEGLLDGIPARKKLLLMDACHSGEYDQDAPPLTPAQQDSLQQKGITFKGFSKGNAEGAPVLGLQNSFEMMQQLFADLRRGSGATVITSSAGVQVSFEDEEWQNGAFTYAFLYGLKSMKADANQDGQVTASEIQAFVAEYVPRLTEGLQVPTFRRENLEFDFRVW